MGKSVVRGRMTSAASGEVVVLLIGMRVNRFRAVRSWPPAFLAMVRMVKELTRESGSGLLGYRVAVSGPREIFLVQYWESRDKLFAYAAADGKAHRPAWAAFNRRARGGRGHVGVWHETYAVPAGGYEQVYADMPAYGLGAAHGLEPVARRGERAAERVRAGARRN